MADSVLSLRDSLVADFDHEMTATRYLLERAPEVAYGWKPHERSFSLGGLATHLANLPYWGQQILDRDGYDLAGAASSRTALETRRAVLDTFDANVAAVRRSLTAMSDAELQAPWTLTRGDQTLLTVPKFSALRNYCLHHAIHHRGQLTVYLRLQGVPLPPLYGPTADEA